MYISAATDEIFFFCFVCATDETYFRGCAVCMGDYVSNERHKVFRLLMCGGGGDCFFFRNFSSNFYEYSWTVITCFRKESSEKKFFFHTVGKFTTLFCSSIWEKDFLTVTFDDFDNETGYPEVGSGMKSTD